MRNAGRASARRIASDFVVHNKMLLLRGGRKMPEADTVRLKTARGSTIVAAFVPYKSDFPAKAQPAKTSYSVTSTPFPEDAVRRPTILISHGTAVDLGRVLPWYRCVSPSVESHHTDPAV